MIYLKELIHFEYPGSVSVVQRWSLCTFKLCPLLKVMDVIVPEQLQMHYITVSDTLPKMDRIWSKLCCFTLDVVKPNAAGDIRGGA